MSSKWNKLPQDKCHKLLLVELISPGNAVPIPSQMLFPLQIVAQLKKGKWSIHLLSTYYYFLHLEPVDTNYKYGGLLGLAHAMP